MALVTVQVCDKYSCKFISNCIDDKKILLFMFTDIDECELGDHNCDGNANCMNTFGSFSCSCNTGYSGDGVNCSKCDTHA